HAVVAGYKMRTKVISSTVPVWLTEFWIPVYLPTLGELLTVKLYDKQDLGGNVLVASLQLRTDHIFRGDAEGLRWYHLAHGDERAESRARTADRHDTRTEPHPHPGLPHPSDYVCGQTPYNTFMSGKRQAHNGYVSFLLDSAEADEGKPAAGVLRKVQSHRPLALPSDPSQLPPIFLLLSSNGTRVGKAKLDASMLVTDTPTDFKPKWVMLAPTEAHAGTDQALRCPLPPAPFISTSLRFAISNDISSAEADGSDTEEEEEPSTSIERFPYAPRSELVAYELRVHVFSGHELAAQDANGLLDGYAVLSLGGLFGYGKTHPRRTSIQWKTRAPSWQETLRLQAWLPPLEVAPDAVLEIWDDDFGADDLVGVTRLRLKDAFMRSPDADEESRKLPTFVSNFQRTCQVSHSLINPD
ncbi:MAG: hypothetical protein SGPRY_009458, partial [Prymnesium sp.]